MVSYAINGAEIHSVIYKPDGAPAGDRASVNAAPPVLGTFYTPVTASTDAAEYLVVMVKNWNWIAGTVFASDKALP